MTASEGENVTLICHASGVPQPNVTWRRESDLPLPVRSPTPGQSGHQISRVTGTRSDRWGHQIRQAVRSLRSPLVRSAGSPGDSGFSGRSGYSDHHVT